MKSTLPGQFVLLVSSQSKEMRRNIFVCSDAQHEIKVVISEQHKNILLFMCSTNFNSCFFHCPKLADSELQKLNYRAAWNAWFSEGVVRFLFFLCRSSPGFDPKIDIPEQHEIKTLFTSSTKLNTWKRFYKNNNLCLIAAQNPKTCFSTLSGMSAATIFLSRTR